MSYETHIPPEQTQKSSQIRIPLADEDSRRSQDHPQTPQSRKKAPGRLKKRFEFSSVKRQGEKLVGKFLYIEKKKADRLRFGITASKRYGNSPERNRFKRLVREAIRLSWDILPQDIEVNVIPRSYAKNAKMEDIQKEILELCKS